MKRFTFIALAITAVLGVTSCTEKEGEFNPKMKVDKLYYMENGQQVLDEVFNWSGNKLVSITDGDETMFTIAYDDKDRISSVTCEGVVFNYTYDGNLLSKITCSEEGLSIVMDCIHDGKKITNIKTTYTYSGYDWDVKGMHFDIASKALGLMMPSQICKNIDFLSNKALQKAVAKGNGAKDETYTTDVNLTWDGKNISRVELKSEWGNEVVNYEYDKNPSPFCNLLLGPLMMEDPSMVISSNNITRSVMTFSDGEDSHTETYTYEYGKKNYPVKVINSYDTTIITYL